MSSFWKPAFVFDYVCTEILPLILAKKYSSSSSFSFLVKILQPNNNNVMWCQFCGLPRKVLQMYSDISFPHLLIPEN